MTDQTRYRQIVIPDMSLKLRGVPPATARQVAAGLPQAVSAAMAGHKTAQNSKINTTDQSAAAITARLADEIAGRVQSGLAKRRGGES